MIHKAFNIVNLIVNPINRDWKAILYLFIMSKIMEYVWWKMESSSTIPIYKAVFLCCNLIPEVKYMSKLVQHVLSQGQG